MVIDASLRVPQGLRERHLYSAFCSMGGLNGGSQTWITAARGQAAILPGLRPVPFVLWLMGLCRTQSWARPSSIGSVSPSSNGL